MRVFILLFCTSVFSLSFGDIFSQDVKIIVDTDKTISVDEVFDLIKRQTNYTFIYQEDLFKNAPKLHLRKGIIKADKLLKECLSFGKFSFNLSDKGTIMLERKSEIITQQQITGAVTDQDGSPMPGVTILIKGVKKGTSTDFDGKYTIKASSNDVLIFSYLGYATQEISVGNKTIINTVMLPSIDELDEIVLTSIGTTQLKDEAGATSSSIKPAEIVKSGETGLINSLSGKASGVRIARQNGDPGAGANIQIRGINSIDPKSPLIVIDGVPTNNDSLDDDGTGSSTSVTQQSRLNDINQNDIENVQILKGASAAALWGSRAANGVILITTKSGRINKAPTFTYSSSLSMDYISVKVPLQNKFGQGRGGVRAIKRTESWGDKISDRTGGTDEFDTSGAYFTSNSGNIYYPVTTKNSQQTFIDSNYDAVFRTGTLKKHDFSVQGGGQKTSYFLSYGLLEQNGIVREANYNRQNFRLNTHTNMTDWLQFKNKIGYTYSKSNRIRGGGSITGLYIGLLRTPPDFDIRDYKGTYVAENKDVLLNRQRSFRNQLGASNNAGYNNPLWTIYEQKNRSNVNRVLIAPEATIKTSSWLDIVLRGGLDFYSDKRVQFLPINTSGSARYGDFKSSTIISKEYNLDVLLKTKHVFNQNFNFNATLGFNFNDKSREVNANRLKPFAVDSPQTITDLNPDDAATTWDKISNQVRRNRGYGLFSFSLYDQLFINASGSLETASTIEKAFFYPSLDLAWQFSDLLKTNDDFFGKLRASWGKVGIDPKPYKFETEIESGFPDYGGAFLISDTKGSRDLKPEIKTEYEIGADLRFLKRKLSLGITYYKNKTDGVLFDVKTNPSSGYNNSYKNAATIENNGLEIDLKAKLIANQDFKLTLETNFNNNKNMVTHIDGGETVDIGGSSKVVQGFPIGVFWLPASKLNENGALALDKNGFPEVDKQRRVIGDPNPDWRGGIGMQLNYKNFDFSFLFEHSQGGDFINRGRVVMYGFGVHADVGNEVTLTEDLVNVNGTLFKTGTTVRGNIADFGAGNVLLDESFYRTRGGGLGYNKLNDLNVEDATWTKLRNVTVGYSLHKSSIKSLPFKSIRLSVTGRDLILWSKIVGSDPETSYYGISNASGMDYFTNPSTRSILFSAKLTF